MRKTRLGPARMLYESGSGFVDLWVPTPLEAKRLSVVMRCGGHGCAEFAAPITATIASAFARGNPEVFDDWEGVTGYDSRLRADLTAWTREHDHRIERTHILVRSRILAMGVAVANLAVGGSLQVYAARHTFEQELLRRVPSYVPGRVAKS